MKPEFQIKALAELDGWTGVYSGSCQIVGYSPNSGLLWDVPDYLTSYDAIIPLIQKQSEHVKKQLADFLGEIALPDYDGSDEFHYSVLHYLICAKPTQLCEALLRATGKWIE